MQMPIYPEIRSGNCAIPLCLNYSSNLYYVLFMEYRKERACILVNLDFANDQFVKSLELNSSEEGSLEFFLYLKTITSASLELLLQM